MSVPEIAPRRVDFNRKHIARVRARVRHKYAKSSAFTAYRIPQCSRMRYSANGIQWRRVAQVEHKGDVGARVFIPSAEVIATNVRNRTYIYIYIYMSDRDGQVPELCSGQGGRRGEGGEEKPARANGLGVIRRASRVRLFQGCLRSAYYSYSRRMQNFREPCVTRVTRHVNRGSLQEFHLKFKRDSGRTRWKNAR
jgi:hypothetical protein